MKKLIVSIIFVFSHSAQSNVLLLFGGDSYDVFLGCLNCGKYNSVSVCNKYGSHGSKYSDESPWNKYASNPPLVVDKDGGFYGYFTANKYKSDRTKIEALVIFSDNADLVVNNRDEARSLFCEN